MKNVAPKAGSTLLFLTEQDIRKTKVTMKDVIDIVEDIFAQYGTDTIEMAPRAGIYPRPESFTQALLARVNAAAGAKIVSVFPSNKGSGLPVTTALIVLTDSTTGVPLAVMDATWITAMRTGAVTAVAAKYLARRDAREVAIIGAGIQGRGNLLALATMLPQLLEARVYDVRPEASSLFIEDMKNTISLKMRSVGTCRDAIEGADIVVTGTAVFKERNALVRRDWVKLGALIAPLEVDRALEASLVYKPDLLVVDDTAQTLAFQKMGCFAEGPPTIHAELGEIVSGKNSGRRKESDIIVAMNVGLAVEDIAVGHHVYRRATERDIGQRLAYS